ncbi:hypothetical protein HanIR_Chr11g0522381 [Helianthus annuus]|nr:hypothetical protein HanIR_Chr11g0522381 [Helianthus annuus]
MSSSKVAGAEEERREESRGGCLVVCLEYRSRGGIVVVGLRGGVSAVRRR